MAASKHPLAVCARPLCAVCEEKRALYRTDPLLRYRPSSLKLQILVQLTHKLCDVPEVSVQERMLQQFALPELLMNELRCILDEVSCWRKETAAFLDGFVACYIRELHWKPYGAVNRRATAVTIAKNRVIPSRNAFLLCANNCLDAETGLAWNRLDPVSSECSEAKCTCSSLCFRPSANRWAILRRIPKRIRSFPTGSAAAPKCLAPTICWNRPFGSASRSVCRSRCSSFGRSRRACTRTTSKR